MDVLGVRAKKEFGESGTFMHANSKIYGEVRSAGDSINFSIKVSSGSAGDSITTYEIKIHNLRHPTFKKGHTYL